MSDGPRDVRSQLGAFVGPSGGDPNLVNKYARNMWQQGGALILPYQMERLPADARAAIEREMETAYGKKRRDHGCK